MPIGFLILVNTNILFIYFQDVNEKAEIKLEEFSFDEDYIPEKI